MQEPREARKRDWTAAAADCPHAAHVEHEEAVIVPLAIAIAAVGGGVAWEQVRGSKAAAPKSAPTVPVSVATVAVKTIPVRAPNSSRSIRVTSPPRSSRRRRTCRRTRRCSPARRHHWAPLIEQNLRASPNLLDVTSDLQITQPQVTVRIDRNKASALGVSALVTLALFGVDLNMYAFVGIVMLVGIVKKNAIMMIDVAIEAQRTESKRRSRRYSTRASPASGRS
jgi:AcrB/AcrD/AcrF family protein